MNLVVVLGRSSLLVRTIASLVLIIIVGPRLTSFDSTNYVKTWLLLQGLCWTSKSRSKKRGETSKLAMCLKFGNYFQIYRYFKIYVTTRSCIKIVFKICI